jgi:endonuclease YncB( thermonuclease family)
MMSHERRNQGRARLAHVRPWPVLRAPATASAALLMMMLMTAWLLLVPVDRARLLERVRFPLMTPRAGGPPASAEPATVRIVIDGDTLVLMDGRTVRLLGIDTPETVHPDMEAPQPFGEAASQRLRALVDGRDVHLERDVSDSDHFGRSLRHVWLGRELVAVTLLREGLGYAQSIPPDRRHAEDLRAAEASARAARRGLWGADRPTPLPIFDAPGP